MWGNLSETVAPPLCGSLWEKHAENPQTYNSDRSKKNYESGFVVRHWASIPRAQPFGLGCIPWWWTLKKGKTVE